MKHITILDCTLRDGSYAIDYQFTAEDTAIIAAGLEQAGLELIEVGHGLGLNASNSSKGVAAATDEEYLEAARKALKKAKFGMFFIPGIGREEDLKLAAKYRMDFVRIGTNVTEVDASVKYVELAKSLFNRFKVHIAGPKRDEGFDFRFRVHYLNPQILYSFKIVMKCEGGFLLGEYHETGLQVPANGR